MFAIIYLLVVFFLLLALLAVAIFLVHLSLVKKSLNIAIRIGSFVVALLLLLIAWGVFLENYKNITGNGSGDAIQSDLLKKEEALGRLKNCEYRKMSRFDFVWSDDGEAVPFVKLEKKRLVESPNNVLDYFIPIRADYAEISGYHEYVAEVVSLRSTSDCQVDFSGDVFYPGAPLPTPEEAASYQEYIDGLNARNGTSGSN